MDSVIVTCLRAFDLVYQLESDVIRCRDCGRSCHVSRAEENFQHRSGCQNEQASTRPWQGLAAILSHIPPR